MPFECITSLCKMNTSIDSHLSTEVAMIKYYKQFRNKVAQEMRENEGKYFTTIIDVINSKSLKLKRQLHRLGQVLQSSLRERNSRF